MPAIPASINIGRHQIYPRRDPVITVVANTGQTAIQAITPACMVNSISITPANYFWRSIQLDTASR